jgi:type I restriction enzyme, S subunit
MSLPRYPEYKDSGVTWLGEVPAHWDTWKLQHAFGSIGSGTTPPSDEPLWYDAGTIPWITTGELREAVICETTKSVTPAALQKFSTLKLHPKGALAIAMYGATIGRLGLLGVDAVTNQACCVLSAPRSLNISFVFYWLLGFKQRIIDLYATGGGQPNINQATISSLRIPAPNLSEQTAIATFLDRETGKINALIAEQEKLIALLAEKRQATISHAVTKGLNPDAPMKDSGVVWLGEVPARWSRPPLYLRYSSELGKMLDANRITGDYLVSYLRNVDVQWDAINFSELPTMDIEPTEYPRYTIRNGDLLVCEGGDVGRAAVVNGINEVIGYQKALHRLRALSEEEHPRYMFYTFSWASKAGVFSGEGQATIAHLTGEQLRKYRFPKPPKDEQVKISFFLDAETTKLDSLKAESERAIELLKERRSALISAAVTGQIDVRGAVTEPEAA